jgi:trimethylamine--corrinoid protein Co-methyltransferase
MGIEEREMTIEFRVLSDLKRQMIHEAALDVLERAGFLMHHPGALKLLKDAGCSMNGEIVKFPKKLVEDCIRKVPKRIDIYNRDGQLKMILTGRNVYYGTGCDCVNVIDIRTQVRRPPVLKDVEEAALLTDALPEVDFHLSMATPTDVNGILVDRYQFATMMNYTKKPLIFTCYSLDAISDIYDMCLVISGSQAAFAQKPFAILFLNTISPLSKNPELIDKLIFAAERKIPIVDIPGPSAGATSPATFAGTLVSSTAESLSGLVLSQIVNPGAPFIFGGNLHIMDMKYTSHPYGGPELPLMDAAMSEMAQFYKLPMFSGGGCTDAHLMDHQAAVEIAISMMMAGLSGGNLVHNLGYIDVGITSSLESVYLGNEVISIVRRILQGIEVNEETLAKDLIIQVGPGGHYLSELHTVKHFRKEFWFPTLFVRNFYQNWIDKQEGKPLQTRIREKVIQILKEHIPPLFSESQEKEIRSILNRAERRGH